MSLLAGTTNEDLGLLLTNQKLINQIMQAHGEKAVISALARLSGYERIPPTIHEFISGKDYLGEMLGEFDPKQGGGLYPEWNRVLKQIFPNPFYSPYVEVIFSGSIGTGKTTAALAGVLYDLCKILCLAEPHKRWMLVKSTVIAFAIFNATLKLAQDVLSSQLNEWIQSSPFFRSMLTGGRQKGATLFNNNIDIVQGSRFGMSLGRAVMGCILDEANFQDKVMNQAYDNYNSIKTRIESRFMRFGSVPAHMYLISSKSDETGWLQTHIEEMRDSPTTYTFEPAIWEVLDCKGIYSGKTFKVFIGDASRDPFIVENMDQIRGIDDALMIDVPIEYEHRFKVDLYRSLQDLAGTGTVSMMNFISSSELIDECQLRPNPITKEVIVLDFFDKKDKLTNYIKFHELEVDSRPRFVHVDLGLKEDRTGIAFTRFDGMVTVKRLDPFTGKTHEIREPIYHTDMLMPIQARPGQEVPIYKVRDVIIDLRARGYPIAKITADGYQSKNLLQDLLLVGFEVEELSVDRKKDAYFYFKSTILESRYSGVTHPIFNTELRRLVNGDKKIDHPPKGSKDLTDAVCGSVYSAYLNQDLVQNIVAPEDYMNAMERYVDGDLGLYGEIMKHATFVGEVYR